MARLEGKVAIITGAASGMGKADALLFAKEGAKVVVTDIQADKVDEVVAEIKNSGGEAIGFRHDVSHLATSSLIRRGCFLVSGNTDILLGVLVSNIVFTASS